MTQRPLPPTAAWQEFVAGGGAAVHKDSVSTATVPECTPHHDSTPDLRHPLCRPMEGGAVQRQASLGMACCTCRAIWASPQLRACRAPLVSTHSLRPQASEGLARGVSRSALLEFSSSAPWDRKGRWGRPHSGAATGNPRPCPDVLTDRGHGWQPRLHLSHCHPPQPQPCPRGSSPKM